MTRFVRAGAAVIAALVMFFGSIGCESFLESDLDEGTYVLESVGGKPLPVLVREDEWHRLTILADTFRLQQGGTGIRVHAANVEYLQEPNRNGPVAWDRQVYYETRGQAIEITHVCLPNELCTAPPHLTGRLTVGELQLNGTPGPYVYRRLVQ